MDRGYSVFPPWCSLLTPLLVSLSQEKAAGEGVDEGHVTERPPSSSTVSTKHGTVGVGSLAGDSGVRELLMRSCDVLQQGIQDISQARDSVIDANGQSIADISWLKVGRIICRLCIIHVFSSWLFPRNFLH